MTNHCTHEQSQALKCVGFDMPIKDNYREKQVVTSINAKDWNDAPWGLSAPTRSEVLQWAREKHGIDGWVRPQFDSRLLQLQVVSTSYVGYYTKGFEVFGKTKNYDTHPEAEIALVDKIIEILKENIHDKTEAK